MLLLAQAPKPPSLKEQLEAQYQQPGTVLVIQKAGILGVPATSRTPCATKYQGGKLTPDASCTASKPLTVGEKVNLFKIEVDEAKGKISFRIGECDACNKVGFSSRTSQIDFQFAKDASVSAVEGSIDEVLTIDEGEAQQAQPAKDSPPAQGQPGEASSDALTNRDVVKMARAKLGDGIILSKIKTSACNFDTSVDALVKLKEAGVSDPVIQAMHDIQEAAKEPGPAPSPEPEPPTPAPVPGQNFSVRHRHRLMGGDFKIVDYYCSGTLSVSPDGTVTYDCAQTDDPSGRCEHESFATGSLKEAKIGSGGKQLHLASKTRGNLDLYGNPDDIKQAQTAIAPFVQTAQK
ncbi:MAG TPA: hypothetical protein VN776_07895 [Terracidiphilus sp.]|nr:hypothetical protein [Terracidiphilus sp.]